MGILDTIKKEKDKKIKKYIDKSSNSNDNEPQIKREVFEATLTRLRRENLDFFESRGWDGAYFLDTDCSEFGLCLDYIESELSKVSE